MNETLSVISSARIDLLPDRLSLLYEHTVIGSCAQLYLACALHSRVRFRAPPEYHPSANLEQLSLFVKRWNPAGVSGQLSMVRLGGRNSFYLEFTGTRDGQQITMRSAALGNIYLQRAALFPGLRGFAMQFAAEVSDLESSDPQRDCGHA